MADYPPFVLHIDGIRIAEAVADGSQRPPFKHKGNPNQNDEGQGIDPHPPGT